MNYDKKPKNKQDAIEMILDLCEEFDLFTNSKTNKIVSQKFHEENCDVKTIISFGEPETLNECSDCRKTLNGNKFKYYQTRVDSKGFLMRTNALCNDCAEKRNKERKEVLTEANKKGKIPSKPNPGDICSHCERPWHGNWHRHHDYSTNEFVEWQCGNCNMSHHDRRNQNVKN